MNAEQGAAWALVFGLGMGAGWLLIQAAQRLTRRPSRRRRQGRGSRSPAMAARPNAGIQLGPSRCVEVTLPTRHVGVRLRWGQPVILPLRPDPLWMEKGWRRNGEGYAGQYRAGRRQWRGLIRTPYPGAFEAYIWDPPLAELDRRTHYRPCFQPAGVGRYRVHFHAMPTSLDHSIATVERVLTEATGGR